MEVEVNEIVEEDLVEHEKMIQTQAEKERKQREKEEKKTERNGRKKGNQKN